MDFKVLFIFALCLAMSFAQDLAENDAATTEAVPEQDNEAEVVPATEASGDSSAPSSDGAAESASAVTEANEPTGDAENAAQLPADGDSTVSTPEDAVENAEPEISTGDDSNGAAENENSEAATTATPQDDNAASTNENSDSADKSTDSTANDTATAEGTTTAPAVEEEPSSPASPSTEAPEFKCESVGRFACPHSCEKYYFCWDTTGDHAVFECPHHRAFDPITQLCVHNFAVCAAAPKCEVDRQISPNPDDKTTFFECKLEENDDDDDDSTEIFEVRKQDCAEGREFNADLGYCAIVPQEDGSSDENSGEKQDCTETGIFIDFSNESRYYECIVKSVSKGKLKLIHHKCPKYHVFSMEDKKCIPLLPVTAK